MRIFEKESARPSALRRLDLSVTDSDFSLNEVAIDLKSRGELSFPVTLGGGAISVDAKSPASVAISGSRFKVRNSCSLPCVLAHTYFRVRKTPL